VLGALPTELERVLEPLNTGLLTASDRRYGGHVENLWRLPALKSSTEVCLDG
jgi:hypothetical protein